MGTDGTVLNEELRMEEGAAKTELAAVRRVLGAKANRLPAFGDDNEQVRRIEKALLKRAKAERKATRGMRWESYTREYLDDGGNNFSAANPHSRALFARLIQDSLEEVGWDEPLWAFTIYLQDEDLIWTVPQIGTQEATGVEERVRRSLDVGGPRVRARMAGTGFIGMLDIGVFRWRGRIQARPHFHGIVSGNIEDLRNRLPDTRGGLMNSRVYDFKRVYYLPGWLQYMAKDLRSVYNWVLLEKGYRFVSQAMPFDLLAYFSKGYRGLNKLDLCVAGGMGSKAMRLVRERVTRD